MALHAEEGADQAQAGADGQQAGHRQRRQRHQLEFGRIQAGKLGNRGIQWLQGQRHGAQGQRTGAQAQQGARVIEGAVDEGIRGADQFRDADFIALLHHLQADGIEDHGDDGHAQGNGQQQQHQAQHAQQGRQALDPGRIDLRRFHARQVAQLLRHRIDILRFAGAAERIEFQHIAVGQGIVAQGAEHVGQAVLVFQGVERLFARDEDDLRLLRADDLAHGARQGHGLLARRVDLQENADFRVDRHLFRHGTHIVEHGQAGERQRQGDGDDEHVQQEAAWRLAQMDQRRTEREAVLTEPASHACSPCTSSGPGEGEKSGSGGAKTGACVALSMATNWPFFRWITRAAASSICSSWLEMRQVTPTE